MATRRKFLAGLLAAGACPAPTWADAGNPDFVAAAKLPDGSFSLIGLRATGTTAFQIPLPGRGHAATAHPIHPEAVAFARRPGTFALVIDCTNGSISARLTAPEGRHFFGHGAFSPNGEILFTTENDYDAGLGVIGVWDARNGYTRLTEFASGGVGPHEMLLSPDGAHLIVANGGIDTHPESGRTKLNIATMKANLSYLTLDGHITDQLELPSELHKNSIRHIAVAPDAQVAFAMQWQGQSTDHPPLLGLHRLGQDVQFITPDPAEHRLYQGYVGSVAMSATGNQVAITSPRGNRVGVFDTATGATLHTFESIDVGGVSATNTNFVLTSGTGALQTLQDGEIHDQNTFQWAFDNHLVAIS